ncbi:pyridoxal phosphate-dependent transferase [Melampsora americana]|nr:pyridoxal phosphate-dependent transferase [Melampsora americana]
MDVSGFRKAGHEAVEKIAEYYERLGSLPVTSLSEPGDVKALVSGKPPLKGVPFDEISDDFEKIILPGITHWQHPSFFSLYPANSTFESIISDMYSAAVNNPGFNYGYHQSGLALQSQVLVHIYKSTSKKGGGTIVGTASEACLTVAIAARERTLRYKSSKMFPRVKESRLSELNEIEVPLVAGRVNLTARERSEFTGKLVMYGSSETHSMGEKAALVLGLRWRSLPVKSQDGWSLRGETLRQALEDDVANGLIPCMLVATLGTTNSGAMDSLDELVEVAKNYPTLWVHVDAAWAGVYLSLPEYEIWSEDIKSILKTPPGVVNSFCTNFHKSGLVSFDCSTFFIRDKSSLTEALELTPHYLKSKQGDSNVNLDFRNWGIPLGRRFRSLKLYFVLRSFGVEGFQAELRRTIDLTNYFGKLIKQDDWFESVQENSLALTIFRMKPPQGDLRTDSSNPQADLILNALNQRLGFLVQATNQISLTSTVLDDQFCFRLAIGRMSEKSHLDQAFKLFQECLKTLKLELKLDKVLSRIEINEGLDEVDWMRISEK